jgi:hypothetical protein
MCRAGLSQTFANSALNSFWSGVHCFAKLYAFCLPRRKANVAFRQGSTDETQNVGGIMFTSGAFWFGIVVGYITYRTLRRKKDAGISDIASVIGAVGGAAVLALFPADSSRFDFYAIGLAAGFFLYLLASLAFSGTKVDEFLGEEKSS